MQFSITNSRQKSANHSIPPRIFRLHRKTAILANISSTKALSDHGSDDGHHHRRQYDGQPRRGCPEGRCRVAPISIASIAIIQVGFLLVLRRTRSLFQYPANFALSAWPSAANGVASSYHHSVVAYWNFYDLLVIGDGRGFHCGEIHMSHFKCTQNLYAMYYDNEVSLKKGYLRVKVIFWHSIELGSTLMLAPTTRSKASCWVNPENPFKPRDNSSLDPCKTPASQSYKKK